MKFYDTEGMAERSKRQLERKYPKIKFRIKLSVLGNAWLIERCDPAGYWTPTSPQLMKKTG